MALRIPLSFVDDATGNHKTIIGWGLVIAAISGLLPVFSESAVVFFVCRALSGVSAATWISYSAHLLEGAGGKVNRNMGYLVTANTSGIFVSQIVGTLLYPRIGIKMLFVIAVLSAAVAFFILCPVPFEKNQKQKRDRTKSAFKDTILNKRLWLCSMLMSIGYFIIFSTNISFTGVFAQENLGATALELGLIGFFFQGSSAVASWILGKLGKRRLPERAILIAGFQLFAVYCILTGFCRSVSALILVQILAGVCNSSVQVILFANAGRELNDDQQIYSMGVFQSLYSIGITLGPPIAGAVFDHMGQSYLLVFCIVAVVAQAGAIWSFFSFHT
jgi:predicted MFS family arabinose efflux permease